MDDPIVMAMRAAVEPTNRPYEELLELAKAHAPDPSVFEKRSAAFWRVQASNNKLDFYGTSMADTTLDNYVEDFNRGVSYQDSHNWGKLGLGQSVLGESVATDVDVDVVGQKLRQVHGTFVTLEGVTVGEYSTDTFLDMIRSGTWRDVSIGFYARDITCSICGKQSYHWWEEDGCTHLPGVEYEIETGEGKNKKRTVQLAWASVNDGRLLETSQVYDGATPDASVNQVVMKANAMSESRSITPRERAIVERRYSVRLKDPTLITPGWSETTYRIGDASITERTMGTGGRVMGDADEKDQPIAAGDGTESTPLAGEGTVTEVGDSGEIIQSGEPVLGAGNEAEQGDELDPETGEVVPDETVINLDAPVAGVDDEPAVEPPVVGEQEQRVVDVLAGERMRLAGTGIDVGKDPVKAVGALADALLEANRRNAELTADAALGKRYREKVIKEALDEGVRARGNDFRREDYQGILAELSVDKIEVIRDDLKGEADRALIRRKSVNRSDEAPGREQPAGNRRKSGAHKVG